MFKERTSDKIMKIERIVSFLPSATELIYELKKENLLFGVTHECNYPKDAQRKLRVVNSVIDSKNLSSIEINDKTCQLLTEGKEIFNLDEDNLREARPDLIISQETCEVCAAYTSQVKKALEILPTKPQIYSMDPHNLEEILETISKLGEILGESKKAENLKEGLQKRISYIKNSSFKEKPKVLALEWIEPFFTAGHWIPEMIEIAGGTNLISQRGEHSRKINFEEISKSDPDIIILMSCGFSVNRIIKEYNQFLKNNPKWNQLRAVKENNLHAVDANSYFSKPSIRTITGLEILAKIIHPDVFSNLQFPDNSQHSNFEPANY